MNLAILVILVNLVVLVNLVILEHLANLVNLCENMIFGILDSPPFQNIAYVGSFMLYHDMTIYDHHMMTMAHC